MEKENIKRDLVLAPGTYAYVQDTSKGIVKVYTGPTVVNPTAQERPVVYNPKNGTFQTCVTLEDAVQKSPIAVEGFYMTLKNPAKKGEHPTDGSSQVAPDLEVGRKINIPGPCMFALWPGQDATYIRGHHLRSNQYLTVRVYNEEEARKNWTSAVAKPAAEAVAKMSTVAAARASATVSQVPEDLTVGRSLLIKGTDVSFYIPPTGISVVPEEPGKYVREALTLERLEYCILVDEDGNKRYERGPQVVFPAPTERFIVNKENSKKFRATELNEIQGLHIKVIAPYTDDKSVAHKEGEELFITGHETAIYYPREEHSLISYDGKSKHFATAIPAGEGRYVMNRLSGEVPMTKGPAMLLPDPRHEVIVRRVLSDRQCELWYPGNTEAFAYNQALRQVLANVPTTRQGVISEGDFERSKSAVYRNMKTPSAGGGMDRSNVSNDVNAMVADEFTRGSSYAQPRTVTLDTKYQGVPSVDVWTGYAVKVVSKTGKRHVEQGPTTILLNYDESLEVLELSTGKPKTTDNLLKTVFLRVTNNKVGELIEVETVDHVKVALKLSLRVNFEGDPNKWFDVDNYVKLLCDHVRSVLKGMAKKYRVEDFYANTTDIIRDTILGKAVEGGKRIGMTFEENGMRVLDVEVLGIQVGDSKIAEMLASAQHEVIQGTITLSRAQRNLESTEKQEEINRKMLDAQALTDKKRTEIAGENVSNKLALSVKEIDAEKVTAKERKEAEILKQAAIDIAHGADLMRKKTSVEQVEALARTEQLRKLEALKAETEAIVSRFTSAQPGFAESLRALTNDDNMVKIAEAWSLQRAIGGENVSDALRRVFEGTPLGTVVSKMLSAGGNGTSASTVPPNAPTRPRV